MSSSVQAVEALGNMVDFIQLFVPVLIVLTALFFGWLVWGMMKNA